MKRHTVQRAILALTVVAIVITVGTIATVKKPAPAEEKQPVTPVPPVTASPVEKPVEDVENFVEEPEITPAPTSSPEVVEKTWTDEEHEILSIIIYQESGGDKCSDDTRLKVGSVFLNRVASPLFPNTFEEVATAERQYGSLHWTGIQWPDRASYEQEAHAVERARRLAEELLINGSILPANVIWQAEFPQGDGIYCYQDGIYFCYSEVSE